MAGGERFAPVGAGVGLPEPLTAAGQVQPDPFRLASETAHWFADAVGHVADEPRKIEWRAALMALGAGFFGWVGRNLFPGHAVVADEPAGGHGRWWRVGGVTPDATNFAGFAVVGGSGDRRQLELAATGREPSPAFDVVDPDDAGVRPVVANADGAVLAVGTQYIEVREPEVIRGAIVTVSGVGLPAVQIMLPFIGR